MDYRGAARVERGSLVTQRGYIGQVLEVRPVLAGMEDRGMPIDDAARIALDVEFEKAQSELYEKINALAPPECHVVKPPQGYKGRGKGGVEKLPPELELADVGHDYDVDELRLLQFNDEDDFSGETYHYDRREFEVPSEDQLSTVMVTRWCRVYYFNPNSKDQIITYMKAKGHPVPKSKETNEAGDQKDTTAAKELIRLATRTGDFFYLDCNEYKGYTKLRSTYIVGFRPGLDGRVHTTLGFGTGIGQLNSRNPNIQNFPKLKPTVKLAKAMRRMVAAPAGQIITEWDFKSCHVITLGFRAESLNYMRLGRLDIHSFVAGHMLGLWDGREIFKESDDELRKRFKWLKSIPEYKLVRDDQAKHGILGIGNGLQAKGLYERYIENFPPRTCGACQGTRMVAGARAGTTKRCPHCRGIGVQSGMSAAEEVLHIATVILFPEIPIYQERERQIAHQSRQLITEFGHIRRFYEVFQWDSQRHRWIGGDQSEEAVAFRLANIAFGHIREKLKLLGAGGLDEKYGLFNNVHDSFMFCFPEAMLDEHIREIHPVLTSPSPVLRHPTICPDGLVIDVEGAWGYNWSEMEEIKVPMPPAPVVASQNLI